jgi:pimeloyl-ACP methyl ester carboxylesterase
VSFGSSLWQLEQWLRDVRDRVGSGRPIVLIGRDQGAALCLTMAAIAPDWLAGVVAIDACIPAINGWSFPANDTGGLQVLFVHDSNPPEADKRLSETAVQEFCSLNAVVEVVSVDGLLNSVAAITPVVSPWLERRTFTHVHRT